MAGYRTRARVTAMSHDPARWFWEPAGHTYLHRWYSPVPGVWWITEMLPDPRTYQLIEPTDAPHVDMEG